jgi:hypothetical protein
VSAADAAIAFAFQFLHHVQKLLFCPMKRRGNSAAEDFHPLSHQKVCSLHISFAPPTVTVTAEALAEPTPIGVKVGTAWIFTP